VDHDLIEGVLLLPDNLFYNTSAAGIVMMLNKRKPAHRKDHIVLLNASKHFRKGRPKNYLPEADIRLLAGMFSKGDPIEGEVAIITRGQAEEADYNLSPSRWVGFSGRTEHRPIREIIADLARLDEETLATDRAVVRLLGQL
jgi:type I restriction enzyme M protein